MRRLILFLALASVGLVAAASSAQKSKLAAKVGLTTRVFHPIAPRNWRGAEKQELRCVIWYPAADTAVETRQVIGPPNAPEFEAGMAAEHAGFATATGKLPLVLLSHGSGGSAEQMAWLGTALARAGYIAVAVDHPGNNAHEPYTREGFALWWERATDLSQALDAMLADETFGPRIDPAKVVAAGYSLGGYTVLELGGAQTDINEFFDFCRSGSEASTNKTEARRSDVDTSVCRVPEKYGLGSVDDILHAVHKTSAISLAASGDSYEDVRIKAIFAIAPAVGFTLTPETLQNFIVPVEIVVGKADRIATPRDNADYIRSQIRGTRETVLPGVTHYTFLDTCTAEGKARLGPYCADEVDRDAIHTQVSAMAVKFFDRALHSK